MSDIDQSIRDKIYETVGDVGARLELVRGSVMCLGLAGSKEDIQGICTETYMLPAAGATEGELERIEKLVDTIQQDLLDSK